MQPTSPKLLGALLAALLFSGVALAQSQDPAGQATPQNPSAQTQAPQSTPQDPNAAPTPLPPPPQPAAPPPEAKKKGEPGSDTPIASPDTVKPKNSKEDVEAVGNRGVGKGVNFYSIEREIGLGKSAGPGSGTLFKTDRRSSHHRIRESRWAKSGPQLRCESSLHHQGD